MKPRRRRGRPKGSKNKQKNIEITLGEKGQRLTTKEDMDIMRQQIAELTQKLSLFTGKQVQDEEKPIGEVRVENLNNVNILTTERKERLEQEIRKCQARLNSSESRIAEVEGRQGGEGSAFIKNKETNTQALMQRMNRARASIAHSGACKLSPRDKNRLLVEKERLEKILHDTLPSLSDCNSKDAAKTNELSHYLYNHRKKYSKEMQRLQNINKLLDPDNPNSGSLRYLWRK